MKQLYGTNKDFNNSEIFCMKNEHSYAAMVCVLSSIYIKAHASENLRTKKYKAIIVVDDKMLTPYKSPKTNLSQPDASVDRLIAISKKMKSASVDLGIILSNKIKISSKSTVGLKHPTSYSWPLSSNDFHIHGEKIISCNLPPKHLSGQKENLQRFFTKNDLAIKDVTYVDYYTPIETLFNILSNSKIHIGYQGGTSWLAVSMSIPTIIAHPKIDPQHIHLKTKLFGQDIGNISYYDSKKNIIQNIRKHPYEHHIHMSKLTTYAKELYNAV